MKNPTIGIKIADGSYFPIMEEGSSKRKRLVLTTVNDNQENVQIDLYKGEGEELLDPLYVGSLLIENITQGPKESSEIELKLGFSQDGTLNAEAGDPGSGQYESMSISMETLGESSVYDTPDFSLDNDIEDLTFDDLGDGEQDITPDIEDLSLDDDIEDLTFDDLDDEEQGIISDNEDLSLGDEMEDLTLDETGDEEPEVDVIGEDLNLDDEMEDLTLDETGVEELEIDMIGEDLSLDDEIEDLRIDNPVDEDQNFDLDSEDLNLDDEDFEFDDLEEEDTLEVEEFEMEVEDEEFFDESSGNIDDGGFEENPDSDIEDEDDYTPGILSDSEMIHREEKEGGNPFLIALLVIIAIAAIAGISYLLFRGLQGEDSPDLEAKAGTHQANSESTEEPVPEAGSETAPEPVSEESNNGEQPKDEATAVPELTAQESTKVLDTTGVWYKIRWGDTLWGISYSFYDSPRDYNEIVKENKIKNPDIIFAETEIFIPSR